MSAFKRWTVLTTVAAAGLGAWVAGAQVAPRAPAAATGAPAQAPPPAVATVGALRITPGGVRACARRRAIAEYKARNGSDLPAEIVPIARRQMLESLIRRDLLVLEAKRRGVLGSDQEAEAQLKRDPFFQVNGRFDPARFEQVAPAEPAGLRGGAPVHPRGPRGARPDGEAPGGEGARARPAVRARAGTRPEPRRRGVPGAALRRLRRILRRAARERRARVLPSAPRRLPAAAAGEPLGRVRGPAGRSPTPRRRSPRRWPAGPSACKASAPTASSPRSAAGRSLEEAAQPRGRSRAPTRSSCPTTSPATGGAAPRRRRRSSRAAPGDRPARARPGAARLARRARGRGPPGAHRPAAEVARRGPPQPPAGGAPPHDRTTTSCGRSTTALRDSLKVHGVPGALRGRGHRRGRARASRSRRTSTATTAPTSPTTPPSTRRARGSSAKSLDEVRGEVRAPLAERAPPRDVARPRRTPARGPGRGAAATPRLERRAAARARSAPPCPASRPTPAAVGRILGDSLAARPADGRARAWPASRPGWLVFTSTRRCPADAAVLRAGPRRSSPGAGRPGATPRTRTGRAGCSSSRRERFAGGAIDPLHAGLRPRRRHRATCT